MAHLSSKLKKKVRKSETVARKGAKPLLNQLTKKKTSHY